MFVVISGGSLIGSTKVTNTYPMISDPVSTHSNANAKLVKIIFDYHKTH